MSMKQDFTDIYTKSSVYYLRLQYLVICYLIVLAAAFFVLPLPRAFGIDGAARLMIGGMLYIFFAFLMVFAPDLLYPLIGKLLSPYKSAQEVEEKFNRLSEFEKAEVEQALEVAYGKTFKKDGILVLTMTKAQKIATNVFFQCLLFELFCLVVLINQDHSLMISNPVTQGVSEALQQYVGENRRDVDGEYFIISGEESRTYEPFSKYAYMAEAIFFMYIIFFISAISRLVSMFIFSRPILSDEHVFPIVKKATQSFKKMVWAVLTSLVMLFVGIAIINACRDLSSIIDPIQHIDAFKGWIVMSTMCIINVLIVFRFVEDWYKLIFHKFS